MKTAATQCESPFSNGDVTTFCYYYEKILSSWLDAYNQCLTKSTNGLLIQISTIGQFNALKNLNNNDQDSFWLGANNFASFRDSQWHWLDGSIVDNSIITWCPDNTHQTAIGTYCAAYNTTSHCVSNYLCSTPLPAPCVASTNDITKQEKSILNARLITSTGTCTNAYGGAYANWWTYSIILLNWFILFCFVLFLINRFNLNKRTIILLIILIILSFLLIIAFAILWGIQYQDILRIPLILVILGCIAGFIFLISILILIANRQHVQRWKACLISTVITIILECGLMLGIILCLANCSGYISLVSTNVDKDIIAALLAALMAAISIIFYNGILYLITDIGQDRIHVLRSNNPNMNSAVRVTTTQANAPRRSQTSTSVNPKSATRTHDRVERATSPVDERILREFYSDIPKDMHQYQLEGRQYVVYEGRSLSDIDPHKKDLTQAMLLQEPNGLREAITRVKNSIHATALTDEIHQAESLLNRIQ